MFYGKKHKKNHTNRKTKKPGIRLDSEENSSVIQTAGNWVKKSKKGGGWGGDRKREGLISKVLLVFQFQTLLKANIK